jgi:hypothetical protein
MMPVMIRHVDEADGKGDGAWESSGTSRKVGSRVGDGDGIDTLLGASDEGGGAGAFDGRVVDNEVVQFRPMSSLLL